MLEHGSGMGVVEENPVIGIIRGVDFAFLAFHAVSGGLFWRAFAFLKVGRVSK